MSAVLLAILFLLVLAALPRWPYSLGWGWYPSGALTLALLVETIVLIFAWA
jgi:Protein of unknown function (DUF3309)